MTRLLSSVALAGVLALSMSSAASARDHDGNRGGHNLRHAPVCKMVTHCEMKRTKWGRWKRVCVTKRICRGGHGGHGHH